MWYLRVTDASEPALITVLLAVLKMTIKRYKSPKNLEFFFFVESLTLISAESMKYWYKFLFNVSYFNFLSSIEPSLQLCHQMIVHINNYLLKHMVCSRDLTFHKDNDDAAHKYNTEHIQSQQ